MCRRACCRRSATMDRPRKFAQPLLTERASDGEIFLAPALSSDGQTIAFLSNGKLSRAARSSSTSGSADAETGKRIRRVVRSTFDPNFEELRLLYSQSAFSPDGRTLAVTAQRRGNDVLYLFDVQIAQARCRRFDLDLESVTARAGRRTAQRIVFSGTHGGITDLYIVNADGTDFRQLTERPVRRSPAAVVARRQDDRVRQRSRQRELRHARVQAVAHHALDVATGATTVLPEPARAQSQSAVVARRHGRSRTSPIAPGTANIFLYDLDSHEHYQLTNVAGAVSALTEYSPSISWARGPIVWRSRTIEDGEYTIWTVNNPRALATLAVSRPAAAGRRGAVRRPTARRQARVRRRAARLVRHRLAGHEHVSATTPYRVRFQPDYVDAAQSIGYTPDAFGRSVFGGTTLVLSDMLGNNHLAISGEINGRLSEARAFLGYTNLAHRWQFSTALSQAPYYFLSSDSLSNDRRIRRRARESADHDVRRAAGVRRHGVSVQPLHARRARRRLQQHRPQPVVRARARSPTAARPARTRSTARIAIRRSTTSTASSRSCRTTRCSATPGRSWDGGSVSRSAR